MAEALAPLVPELAQSRPLVLARWPRTAARFREAVAGALQLAGNVPDTRPHAGPHPGADGTGG